jgi:D-tyrosyl-tRNA(Tyr) deacylase
MCVAASINVRVLVQRVTSASVVVDEKVVGRITPEAQGLVALVGVTHSDNAPIARQLAEKLWRLRILDGEASAADTGAPILVISQLSWNAAAPGAVAEPLVAEFVAALRELGARVQTGVFGADMHVALVNDGPVTVMLEL